VMKSGYVFMSGVKDLVKWNGNVGCCRRFV
jgi:hypothetical protein